MVVKFTILARRYFAGFYFHDFIGNLKKGVKFCDSPVLNFILFFKKSELFKFLKFLDKDLYEPCDSHQDYDS